MKNILVTGATGLLGSNMVSRLTQFSLDPENLCRVIAIGKRSLSWEKYPFLNDISYVKADINDYASVDHIINHYDIDYIYHLAAEAIVKSANDSPLRALENNIMGTANVLESARHNHVRGVICMASDKYYGQNLNIPYKEDYPPMPSGVHEVSKTCSDFVCQMYGKNYDVPVISVRGANLFGPGDWNFTRLVPNSIMRMLEGKNPMLWSDVLTYQREFVYVKDAVDILVSLMSNTQAFAGESVNLGIGSVWQVKDFVHEILDAMCTFNNNDRVYDIDVNIKEHYFHEIPKQSLDLNKLKMIIMEDLPNRTDNIQKCLSETISFYADVKSGNAIRKW